ncbi:signal peptidase II [Anaerotignum sp.]|uniref:signal peptidase II n=1 Tax=Anaerotignum sp. TaxID=2039241 RepID=UPI0033220AB2
MWLIPAIAAAILIGLDQATKLLALANLKPIGSMALIDGFMDLTFVENRGVAFGMFSGQRWFILLLTGLITAALVYFYLNLPKTKEYKYVRMAMVLIFAGAIGNMIDRIFRGYVVDFFEFTFFNWPVFNVADIYVVIGVAVLAFLIMFVIKDPEEEKKKDE